MAPFSLGVAAFRFYTALSAQFNPYPTKGLHMDVIFNCPKCDQELAVDSSGAGSEIDCPSCGESIVIPGPDSVSPPLMRTADEAVAAGMPINPISSSAAAKVQKHLRVPVHKATEVLIEKPL